MRRARHRRRHVPQTPVHGGDPLVQPAGDDVLLQEAAHVAGMGAQVRGEGPRRPPAGVESLQTTMHASRRDGCGRCERRHVDRHRADAIVVLLADRGRQADTDIAKVSVRHAGESGDLADADPVRGQHPQVGASDRRVDERLPPAIRTQATHPGVARHDTVRARRAPASVVVIAVRGAGVSVLRRADAPARRRGGRGRRGESEAHGVCSLR